MSDKQMRMRQALLALYLQVPEEVAKDVMNVVMDAVGELESQISAERQKCKEDVCMHCGKRTPQVNPIPMGPNSAGNWVHDDHGTPRLCGASAIFSRERFEKGKQQ